MIKIFLIIFTTTCFFIQNTQGSDTLILSKTILLDKIGTEYAPGYLLIENKVLNTPYTRNIGAFNNLQYSRTRYSQVYFRNSIFGVYEYAGRIDPVSANTGFFVIDSCTINLLPIDNTGGDIRIGSSIAKVLEVRNTKSLNLSLSNDSAISIIVFENNRNLKLQLIECAFKDSGEVRIFNSTLNSFDFAYHKRSGSNIYFRNDTINSFGAVSMSENEIELRNYRSWYNQENIFTFSNCYINAPFVFFEHIPNSTLIFDNCIFGPNVYLTDLAIDKLVFRNCRNFPEQIAIGFREDSNEVKLELVNSNLDNIRFDFPSNVKLIFDSLDSKDAINNSYKSLLEKFDHEGKGRSYKLVDLQYRNFNDSKIFHFLNCIWWYHGYMPGLVFAWALFFLLVFWIFNRIYWKEMLEAYPLNDGQKSSTFNQKGKKLRFNSIVLLYTCFIFFSLRIDFNKVNFKKHRFIYAFLAQYILGLWCMLFIVRFIFKI